MSSLRRDVARAAAAAAVLLSSTLAAQDGVRVMPYGGMTPFVTIAAGGQAEVGVARNASVFADYNLWGWGLHCMDVAEPGVENRCGEGGWSLHGGGTVHLYDAEERWRPYVSLGGGAARVTVENPRTDPQLSLVGETGFDVRAGGPLSVRLGLRWQGRPSVGTDYAGPVIGLRLHLR